MDNARLKDSKVNPFYDYYDKSSGFNLITQISHNHLGENLSSINRLISLLGIEW